MDATGPDCHCGGRGCVEAIAGTDAIVAQARDHTGRPDLTIDEAVALARCGHEEVRAVFTRAGSAIGCGIAAVANLVGPTRIVVSGEGLAAYDLFDTHIRTSFERQAFGAAARCPLSIRPLPFEEWAAARPRSAFSRSSSPDPSRPHRATRRLTMPSPTRSQRRPGRRRTGVPLVAATLAALLGVGAAPASAAPAKAADPAAATAAVAERPFMGWTSWSMQSSKYPGLNPNGDYSYLTEANVLKQADAVAAKLKAYGYEYVNIDAGWWRDNAWVPKFDQYARQTPDPVRFPSGMKAVADHIHAKGLKPGIYLPVGLEKEAYANGAAPIWNASGCTTADIVYPDLRTTNGWDSAYKINFDNPCAQKYIDSQAQLFADWGYDFLKLDGVGPGSFKSGDNYDNVADVAAWQKAIAATGRPIHLELSWSLDINHAADWKRYSNGWRIDTDVECYCNTLVSWENSVDDRFDDAPAWSRKAGPGGWNDLDSLNVGNGEMDGLTKAERQSYATLWAISKSPLYTGDDVTRLDEYGLSLLTNREVIAIDQNGGAPARPVTPVGDQQVWGRRTRTAATRSPCSTSATHQRRSPPTGRPSASPATRRSATCGTAGTSGRPRTRSRPRCPRTARGCSPSGPAPRWPAPATRRSPRPTP
ncbi:hypothetical protein GCM10027614_02500 [Micromonospora vulcania]